ncbi:MAG: FAD-dependent oxidoreductase, partial [Saprospiraceae bacterium]|nr:FAD-dependent oxidoreductase [Saprospiraceae bacterium]
MNRSLSGISPGKILWAILPIWLWMSSCFPSESHLMDYDVVIYGGTSAGIAAAIQVKRMSKSVLLIEPSSRIGGLTTGGLGQTDIGNKQVIGGIAREFYQGIKKYYDQPSNWKFQGSGEYQDGGQTRTEEGEQAMWTFEPSAALKVFDDLISEYEIPVIINKRLDRTRGVNKEGTRITSVKMLPGEEYRAGVFIDATYEGDLMATAGVRFVVGREANSQYGETLNGVHTRLTDTTMTGYSSNNQINHNFVDGVDPFVVKGDPSSGLLPGIDSTGPGEFGTADHRVQAYCFRMCLTD